MPQCFVSMRLIPVTAYPYIDLEGHGKFGCRDHMLPEPPGRVLDSVVGNLEYDIIADTVKIRRAGFVEAESSDAMFLRLFERYRAERIIP